MHIFFVKWCIFAFGPNGGPNKVPLIQMRRRMQDRNDTPAEHLSRLFLQRYGETWIVGNFYITL